MHASSSALYVARSPIHHSVFGIQHPESSDSIELAEGIADRLRRRMITGRLRRHCGPAVEHRRASSSTAADGEECCGGGGRRAGYVPVLVGVGAGKGGGGQEGLLQRFLVRVEVLQHPDFLALLEMAAEEFGYEQQGVLRIPCQPRHFQRVLHQIDRHLLLD